jgi:hypothetical protein
MGRQGILDGRVAGLRPGQPLERIGIVVQPEGRPSLLQLAAAKHRGSCRPHGPVTGDFFRTQVRTQCDQLGEIADRLHRADLLDADEAVALLRQRTTAQEASIKDTGRVLGMLARGGLSRLCIVEVEHAQALRRAEINWMKGLVEEIETGRLEWFAGIREPVVMEVVNS